jgi:hypothetical protein
VPTGIVRCRHGADPLLMVPTLAARCLDVPPCPGRLMSVPKKHYGDVPKKCGSHVKISIKEAFGRQRICKRCYEPHVTYRVHCDDGIYVQWSWFATFTNYKAALHSIKYREYNSVPCRRDWQGAWFQKVPKSRAVWKPCAMHRQSSRKFCNMFPEVFFTRILFLTALEIKFPTKTASSGNYAP